VIQRNSPGWCPPAQPRSIVGPEPSGRSAAAGALVPGLQIPRVAGKGVEGAYRIEEVQVVAGQPIQVIGSRSNGIIIV
jgi:hypothetical protein